MDYKKLLDKYVNWVVEHEGTDFVSFNAMAEKFFSKEEIQYIKSIE